MRRKLIVATVLLMAWIGCEVVVHQTSPVLGEWRMVLVEGMPRYAYRLSASFSPAIPWQIEMVGNNESAAERDPIPIDFRNMGSLHPKNEVRGNWRKVPVPFLLTGQMFGGVSTWDWFLARVGIGDKIPIRDEKGKQIGTIIKLGKTWSEALQVRVDEYERTDYPIEGGLPAARKLFAGYRKRNASIPCSVNGILALPNVREWQITLVISSDAPQAVLGIKKGVFYREREFVGKLGDFFPCPDYSAAPKKELLSADAVADFKHSSVQSTAASISSNLSVPKLAEQIRNTVLRIKKYDRDARESTTASSILLSDAPVNCVGVAILSASLLRAKGIPSRIVAGWGIDPSRKIACSHAWTEYYDKSQWHILDDTNSLHIPIVEMPTNTTNWTPETSYTQALLGWVQSISVSSRKSP